MQTDVLVKGDLLHAQPHISSTRYYTDSVANNVRRHRECSTQIFHPHRVLTLLWMVPTISNLQGKKQFWLCKSPLFLDRVHGCTSTTYAHWRVLLAPVIVQRSPS